MLFLFITAVLVLYLLLERCRFIKVRSQIPIRIHVYGTRGKTSTTRQIYDMLRHAKWRVLAKTTGDEPLLFFPDGRVQKIKRWGPARIQEYMACLYQAHKHNCDAVVFECMALAPESIVMTRKILDPTHVIITNTRPDHYECMGRTPQDIAETLALSVNPAAITIVLEDEQVGAILAQVQKTKGFYHLVPYDRQRSPASQTHLMALELLKLLDVHANYACPYENWSTFSSCYIDSIGCFQFLNLFSANDVVSSKLILDHALSQLKQEKKGSDKDSPLPVVALLATRPDRPLRTEAFVEWLSKESPFTHIICVGWHQFYAYTILGISKKTFSRAARDIKSELCIKSIQDKDIFQDTILYKDINNKKIILNINPIVHPTDLLISIRKVIGNDFAIVGLGNMHGFGEKFINLIKQTQ